MSNVMTSAEAERLEMEANAAGAVFEDAVAELDIFDSRHDDAWSAEEAMAGALAREVSRDD